MRPLFCRICGFPIMANGCLHAVMGLTADQWRDLVRCANPPDPARRSPRYLIVTIIIIAIVCLAVAAMLSTIPFPGSR